MDKKLEDKIQSSKLGVTKEIKRSIFDIVAVLVVAALALASLDVFDLADITSISIADFFISWIPYFLASMLLTLDLYKKGVYIGKATDKFEITISSYGEIVNNLSGKQIRELQPFCEHYNKAALISLRTSILKEEGISYEEFDEEFVKNDVTYDALKTWTRRELKEGKYNFAQRRAIFKAKRAKVKGISVNLLLSNINANDPTNIGNGEAALQNRKLTASIVRYLVSTAVMSLIIVKDISQWGWAALIGTSFKVLYTFASSYMSYFRGYDDVTIALTNHIARKTDILKMFLNYKPVSEVNTTSSEQVII